MAKLAISGQVTGHHLEASRNTFGAKPPTTLVSLERLPWQSFGSSAIGTSLRHGQMHKSVFSPSCQPFRLLMNQINSSGCQGGINLRCTQQRLSIICCVITMNRFLGQRRSGSLWASLGTSSCPGYLFWIGALQRIGWWSGESTLTLSAFYATPALSPETTYTILALIRGRFGTQWLIDRDLLLQQHGATSSLG